MIIPTVGSVLHYFSAHPEHEHEPGPWKCQVNAVKDDRTVSIGGMTPNGHAFWELDVQLLQEDDQKPDVGTWCEWPPEASQI